MLALLFLNTCRLMSQFRFMNCLCSQQVASDQSILKSPEMCGSKYLAQPSWCNLPEWKENKVCIYSRSAAGCRQINFVFGVEGTVREKKDYPTHSMH